MRDWKTWLPKEHPYHPPDYDEHIVMAMRAFASGTANDGQQKIVWDWLQYATGTGQWADMTFRPGGVDAERESAFAEGKRFVGLQILKLLHPATLEVIERERVKKAVPAKTRGNKK
jgi:hypothetical protein